MGRATVRFFLRSFPLSSVPLLLTSCSLGSQTGTKESGKERRKKRPEARVLMEDPTYAKGERDTWCHGRHQSANHHGREERAAPSKR